MNISERGLALIKESEGCELIAYRDAVGVLTIGYGHIGPDVRDGMMITQARADELLREDVRDAEKCVGNLVSVPLTQGQFDALVDFSFNLGCGRLRGSTLLRLLNDADYSGACAQFAVWTKGRVNGKLVDLPGLMKRRSREAELFSAG